jgi:hypothetical protein
VSAKYQTALDLILEAYAAGRDTVANFACTPNSITAEIVARYRQQLRAEGGASQDGPLTVDVLALIESPELAGVKGILKRYRAAMQGIGY